MTMKLFYLLLILLLGVSSLFANDWQTFMRQNSLPPLTLQDPQPTVISTKSSPAAAPKNLKVALLMSAVVPGAGQVYAKSYYKAAAFLAVEVAAWSVYSSYNGKGKDIENEFHAYAGAHWSEQEYWRWIAQQSGIAYDPNNIDPLRAWEHTQFSHGLNQQKDQQYYEMIGKYHQFNYGWDDFRAQYPITMTHEEMTSQYIVSSNRYYYESRRNASNDAFKTATTGVTVVMINHILSAIDAAWTTSVHNRQVTTSLRLEPIYYAYQPQTALTLRMTW
jgi:hypothetical protein